MFAQLTFPLHLELVGDVSFARGKGLTQVHSDAILKYLSSESLGPDFFLIINSVLHVRVHRIQCPKAGSHQLFFDACHENWTLHVSSVAPRWEWWRLLGIWMMHSPQPPALVFF